MQAGLLMQIGFDPGKSPNAAPRQQLYDRRRGRTADRKPQHRRGIDEIEQRPFRSPKLPGRLDDQSPQLTHCAHQIFLKLAIY